MKYKLWVPVLLGLGYTLVSLSVTAQSSTSEEVEEIVIAAHPLSGEGLSQASDVLEGGELQRKLASNIGETLAQQPGIHSAQFGNAVGRPVIHGLGGPRIRIMEDRIDTLDVSVTSPDHAVTVEPFIAERIEVLKGPSTLLYGSGAIGGVVDVHTGRIPHAVPDQLVTGGVEARFDSNTDGSIIATKLNGGSGSTAWHLDGTWKDGDDYEIPGLTESAQLIASEDSDDQSDHAHSVLPGSAFDSSSLAGGASYIADWGIVGASISRLEAEYGLPGSHGHEEEHGEEEHDEEEHDEEEHDEEGGGNPILDMQQTRGDFELGVKDPFGVFNSLNVRLGVNDYQHREIEPDGEVATTFTNQAWELRSELSYELVEWRGAIGWQHTDREFSAIGEEAFVPPVDSQNTGIFWVGERDFETVSVETGIRLDRVEHRPVSDSGENFTTWSASLGFVFDLTEALQAGVVADYSSRAPVVEELYSNGPHLATGTFELGDAALDKESAFNLSATMQYDNEVWSASATVYYTQFADFIYEQATGREEDGLPVFEFRQDDANFFGVDTEVSVEVAEWNSGNLQIRGLFDFVNAELDVDGNDNVPRIPPLRYGAGLEMNWGFVTASIDYLHVQAQEDIADHEFVTDPYNDLRAYLSVDVPVTFGEFSVFLSGKNLTNDEQRRHTSFIKDFAPAPGRAIEAGVRLLF